LIIKITVRVIKENLFKCLRLIANNFELKSIIETLRLEHEIRPESVYGSDTAHHLVDAVWTRWSVASTLTAVRTRLEGWSHVACAGLVDRHLRLRLTVHGARVPGAVHSSWCWNCFLDDDFCLQSLPRFVDLDGEENDDEPEDENNDFLYHPVDQRNKEKPVQRTVLLKQDSRLIWSLSAIESNNEEVNVDSRLVDNVERHEQHPRVEVETTWPFRFNSEQQDE
jgi:hypothetical protein